jgi:hypothetical protein
MTNVMIMSNLSYRRTSHSFTIKAELIFYDILNTTLTFQGFGNRGKLDLCVGAMCCKCIRCKHSQLKEIMQYATSNNLPVNRKKRKTMMSVYPK